MSEIAPPYVTEIENESVYGTHSKMDLTVQIDTKSGQLKNEIKSELLSTPGNTQESANGTTVNVFGVRLMVQFRVHLIVRLKLYLKMYFKI